MGLTSDSHRTCETCAYCTFTGNCERYGKPLVSIEQPACDAYETHPLLTENLALRGLVLDMWDFFCVVPDKPHSPRDETDFCIDVWQRISELGIEVE